MARSMSLISVNAILILNAEDGSRVLAKYYNAPHHAAATHGSTIAPPSPSHPIPLHQNQFVEDGGD